MTASNLISTSLGESFAVTCVTSIRYLYCLHCSWLALQSIISNGRCVHACALVNGDQPFTAMHTWNDSQGVFLFDFSVYSEKCLELLEWILPERLHTRNRRSQWAMSMMKSLHIWHRFGSSLQRQFRPKFTKIYFQAIFVLASVRMSSACVLRQYCFERLPTFAKWYRIVFFFHVHCTVFRTKALFRPFLAFRGIFAVCVLPSFRSTRVQPVRQC